VARKNGTARAVQPRYERAADRFSIYTERLTGARFRHYCLKHGITFTELAVAAIDYFIQHCPPPKRATLHLPRGSRLRPSR